MKLNKDSCPAILPSLVAAFFLSSSIAFAQSSCTSGQVGGEVYRDYNANGQRDSGEPAVSDIRVLVTGPAAEILSDTRTDASGRYVASTSGKSARVEFSEIPSFLSSGPEGASSVSTIAFADAAGNCALDLGLSSPKEHCEEDPLIATSSFVAGDALGGGSAAQSHTVVAFPYSSSGSPSASSAPAPLDFALHGQTGATWGLANQRSTKHIFATAMAKRHTSFGPLGSGGLYSIDYSDLANPVVTPFVDLKSIGINTGDILGRNLPAEAGLPSIDASAFDAVGRVALGGVDISDDEKTLWLVNLADQTLYSVFIDIPARTPTAADVTAYPIGNPGCTAASDVRPWGVTIHDGAPYVGVVCSAESTQQASDLEAIVLRLENGSFLEVLRFNLSTNYPRGYTIHPAYGPQPSDSAAWRPWASNYAAMGVNPDPFTFVAYPQPLVGSLSFDSAGNMLVGLIDRAANQFGPFQLAPNATSQGAAIGEGEPYVHAPAGGDTLYACKVSNNLFTVENNARCRSSAPTAGVGNLQGPGGGEYFFDDSIAVSVQSMNIDVHQELTLGAVVVLPGRDELLTTMYDLYAFEDAGVAKMSLGDGVRRDSYEVYSAASRLASGTFGKAAGLGDLEPLCSPAPIQIGNRVWRDEDGDGVQDAGERGITNVTLNLYSSTRTLVATTTTSSAGEYLFGPESNVQPGTDYILCADRLEDNERGGPLAGLILTSANQGGDTTDSDASLIGGIACISIRTGAIGDNDHTFDIGFTPVQCTEHDLSVVSLAVDGGGTALNELVKQALGARNKLAKRGQCKGISKRKQKQLRASAQELYLGLWNSAWAIGAKAVSCSAAVASCQSVNVSSSTTTVSANEEGLVQILDEVLNKGCKKNSGRKRSIKKEVLRAQAEIAAGLETLAGFGPLVRCE